MKTSIKVVQFDQLRPYYLTTDSSGISSEHLYDLSALLRHIMSNPLSNTKKRVFGDIHLFHTCAFDDDLKIWELQILHLREKILPGIADGDGAYELIRLDEGQYPAESTTILYDQMRQMLYLQRNIYGTSIHAMEVFLQLLSPPNVSVVLKPVIQNSRLNRIVDTNLYRRIILVADTEQLGDEQNGTSLAQTLRSFGQYQGRIVRLDLGFGRQRNGLLKADTTAKLVREAYAFSGTQILKVRTSDCEDVAFETLDLLDDRACYKIEMSYSRENPITHNRLYFSCRSEFKNVNGL